MPNENTKMRVILLRNLLKRMTFNEPQGLWKLSGEITRDERVALEHALEELDAYSNRE